MNYLHMSYKEACALAPVEEPARQWFFIERCRGHLNELKRRIGKDCITFRIETFGCQMNARDSEKLLGILQEIGYVEASDKHADFVLFNTCTVRENANQKVYGRLGQLGSYKKKNPHMMIVLCGCMMQEEVVVTKIKTSYRFVDLIFGTHNLFKLAELLDQRMEAKQMIVDVWKDTDQIVENLPTERKYPFKSGVNIMFGCNNFCSYCIVPYVRGRERSRSPEDILAEIKQLTADGVVEIMLLGQNVNSYGKELEHPVSFADLLKRIDAVPGLERIRFMTPHPKDLSDELIEVMKQSKHICNHLHLPVQSGSTSVLTAMNRRYSKEQYLKLVDKIRTAMPDLSLTTDIIVGFPGETEADFEETLDVVRTVRYDSAFTFIYSKRTGTPAATMKEQVSDDAVKDRFSRLLKEVQTISAEVSGRDLHTTQQVLVEGKDEQVSGYLTGRLSNNTLVHFKGEASLIGQLVPVYLEESKGFYYIGKL